MVCGTHLCYDCHGWRETFLAFSKMKASDSLMHSYYKSYEAVECDQQNGM